MKIYDGGKVISGLIIFLILVTFPVWYNVSNGTAGDKPEPKIITDAKQCVAPTDVMRDTHMEMLNTWRDQVVRHDDRFFVAPDGKRYEMSLSHTCMKCHANKSEFCDRCHNYVGVDPYCWNCHVAPKEVKK